MKSIKILTLGNSYSNDACAWLEKIFKSASYDDVIANALAHPYEITRSKYALPCDKAIVMDGLNIDEYIAAVGGEHLE